MISSAQIAGLAGNTLINPDGTTIGKIVDVYESTTGAEGTFVTVATGLFGSHSSFVPLAKAELRGDDVVVPYDKDLIKDAPRVEVDEELTAAEEDRLYQHYNLNGGTSTAGAGGTVAAVGAVGAAAAGRHSGEQAVPRGGQRVGSDKDGVFDDVKDTAVGRDTSGLTTDDAMTRSEERLHVGTERVEAGRVKLRKRIVTEIQTVTVPVSHTEAKVIREPITDANRGQALDGPALTEAEIEVVLTRDVPVVEKEVVAVERIRLEKETVTEQAKITEQVRKEQIEQVTDVVPPRSDRPNR